MDLRYNIPLSLAWLYSRRTRGLEILYTVVKLLILEREDIYIAYPMYLEHYADSINISTI